MMQDYLTGMTENLCLLRRIQEQQSKRQRKEVNEIEASVGLIVWTEDQYIGSHAVQKSLQITVITLFTLESHLQQRAKIIPTIIPISMTIYIYQVKLSITPRGRFADHRKCLCLSLKDQANTPTQP